MMLFDLGDSDVTAMLLRNVVKLVMPLLITPLLPITLYTVCPSMSHTHKYA